MPVKPVTQQRRVLEGGGSSTEKGSERFQTNLPIRKITRLPSNFLPYPEGVEISYVPYTFDELLTFGQSNMSKADSVEFILRGIHTEGIEKHQLAFFDFIFISLLRKMSSFRDDDIIVEYDCYNCGKKNHLNERMSQLDFKDLDIPRLPIKVKVEEGIFLHFIPITIKSFLELERMNKMEDKIAVWATAVTNMERSMSIPIIKNAQGNLLRALLYVDDKLSFGLKPLERNCKECKASNTLGMDEPEAFIYPFRGSDGLIGDVIQFDV